MTPGKLYKLRTHRDFFRENPNTKMIMKRRARKGEIVLFVKHETVTAIDGGPSFDDYVTYTFLFSDGHTRSTSMASYRVGRAFERAGKK